MGIEHMMHCNECGHSFSHEFGECYTCDTCGEQVGIASLPEHIYDAILTVVTATNGGFEEHQQLISAAHDKIQEEYPPCACGGNFGDHPPRCHKCHSTDLTEGEELDCHSGAFHMPYRSETSSDSTMDDLDDD